MVLHVDVPGALRLPFTAPDIRNRRAVHHRVRPPDAEEKCTQVNPDCVHLRLSWMYDVRTMNEGEHSDFLRIPLLFPIRFCLYRQSFLTLCPTKIIPDRRLFHKRVIEQHPVAEQDIFSDKIDQFRAMKKSLRRVP